MQADYVIVGAGAAGCVLADDLSRAGASVVLLEAGEPARNINTKIPAAFSKLFKGKHDWNYETVPQPHLDNRCLYWPRGKMLGGSTSMNAMIYQRGHRATYDQWAAAGNPGWGYTDLLPVFMALEDQQRGASDFHGVGGSLGVTDLRTVNPLSQAFVDAAVLAGFTHNDDFNDAGQTGFGTYQVTQRDGRRESAATAFLKPAMARPNLTVLTGAHAVEVVLRQGRAVGVEYADKTGRHVAYASSEVILSGGAINSPQLLMLSGIGPGEHLQSVGVDVAVDSPRVGKNLIDHLVCGTSYAVNQPISLAHAEAVKPVLEYARNRTGMLTSNVAEAGGFVQLDDANAVPEIQFHFGPVYFNEHGLDSPKTDGMSIGATLVHVESTGEITLASADPFAAPRIDPRYLSNEQDLWRLVEGCKLSREIAATSPLVDFYSHEYLPGSHITTDEQWVEHVRTMARSLYHPVGTCAMGPADEDVLDAELRVRGIDALRVADASVMPSIINANTQAVTMVIGKLCAEFILAD